MFTLPLTSCTILFCIFFQDKKEDAAKKRKIYREASFPSDHNPELQSNLSQEKRAQSLSQLTSLATPSNQFRVVPEEDKLNGIMPKPKLTMFYSRWISWVLYFV